MVKRAMKKQVEIRGVQIGGGIPKICVPITDRTLQEIENSAKRIMEYPVDMIEWRIDWFDGVEENDRVLKAAKSLRAICGICPLIFTNRTVEEGGMASVSRERYHELNLLLAESGCVDLIDVQMFFGAEKTESWVTELQKTGVKVVGSWHNFDFTPSREEMVQRLCRMQELGADICKLAVMPLNEQDVHRLMLATREMSEQYADRPLITMSMSGLGVASRIAGEYYGADVTFGTLGKASAPGQVPVTELRAILTALHEKKKLVLIGFMGSGKSTVGSTLATGLDCPIYDTDQMIEEQEGVTIKELFATKGEAYFRQRETAVLLELAERGGLAVISTGGGLPMTEANHQPMKDLGVVIFLKVRKESVIERLKGDQTRPLLAGPEPEKKIEELLKVRTPVYEKAADLIILTDSEKNY